MMNPIASKGARERLDSLDGWRTISVALVVIDHLVLYSSIGTADRRFAMFDSFGHLGVEIFFVISGFVICRGLEKELVEAGRVSIAAFYIRRFFRILPPLLFYLAVMVALRYLALVDYDVSALPRALSFTCNIWHGCGGYAANHLWSLSVEEQFYLVFPILLISLANSRKAALGILLCAFPFGMLALNALKWNGLAEYFSNFLCISAGVACAQYEPEIRKLCRVLPKWTPIASFLALLLLVAVAGPDRWSTVGRYYLLPLLIAIGLMTTVFQESATNRVLSKRWITTVGRASYTLYLWQQLATAPYSGAGYLFYALSIPALVGFSCLSFFFVERGLIGVGARLSGQLRRRTAPIVSVPTAT